MRKKRTMYFILTIILCYTMNLSVFARESSQTISPIPPISTPVTSRGSNAPSGSADIHNLSISDYNYQISNMGYRVYTSKWITGASSIYIDVNNWNLIKSYHGAANNMLTLRIYNSKKKQVDSTTITISRGGGGASFSNLKSSAKYYVCFEVPTNGNRYSFDGFISQN